jgi:hypothetical protein
MYVLPEMFRSFFQNKILECCLNVVPKRSSVLHIHEKSSLYNYFSRTLPGVAFGDGWWKHLLETYVFSKNRECRKRNKNKTLKRYFSQKDLVLIK